MKTIDEELREIFDLDNYVHPEYEEDDDPSYVSWGSLGGQTSAQNRREKGEGMFDPEWQKKYNGAYSPNNPFKNPEWQKKYGYKNTENRFTVECHKAGGKASTAIKYKCNDCDMISSIGGITTHVKYSKHNGYERLVNGNKTR